MINVAYCSDSEGYFGLEASLYSLLTHTKGINFYIFTMDYSREEYGVLKEYHGLYPWQKNKLIKIVKYLDGKNSRITFIDMHDTYQELFVQGVNEFDGHSSPYAPLRLCWDLKFPHLDHVLYLDCDTIIQEDLTPMYWEYYEKIKQSPYCYCGFANPLGQNNEKKEELVNSVVVFDLQKCYEHNYFAKVRWNLTHNFYQWYEQSAMEDTEDYVRLPETYNYMHLYEERTYEPAILHFACDLSPKVYHNRELFFKKYPHLKYIKDGLDALDLIPINSKQYITD